MGENENNKREGLDVGTRAEPRSPSPEPRGLVQRRDILRVIGSVPAAALIPIPPALAEQSQSPHAHPTPAASARQAGRYQPRVLTEHEWKTITMLSDIIIPADERSGSAT